MIDQNTGCPELPALNNENLLSQMLGELTPKILHSLKNPLGAIKGFANLLERDHTIKDDALAYVQKIVAATARIEALLQMISELNYSGRNGFNNQNVSAEPARIIKTVCISEQIKYSIDGNSISANIRVAPQILELIFVQLVRKFREHTDSLKVDICRDHDSGQLYLELRSADDVIAVFRNNDIVFDYCRKIVELQYGNFEIEPDGLAVRISFPMMNTE